MAARKIPMTQDRLDLIDLIEAHKVQRYQGPRGHVNYRLVGVTRVDLGSVVTKRVRTLLGQGWVTEVGGVLLVTDAGVAAKNVFLGTTT
jgi:hypothetical protein